MLEPVTERQSVECAAPPASLWPSVSDTNRLNAAAGLGAVEVRPNPTGGPARHLVTAKLGPLTLEWAELPFEWEAPRRLSVRREVTKGPVERIEFSLSLDERGAGSRVELQVSLTPRHRRAQPVAAVAARLVTRKLADAVARLDAEVGDPAAGGAESAKVNRRALDAAMARLEADAPARLHGLGSNLRRLLERGRDHELERVRPYELAEAWGVERRAALELCLYASVAGLLDLRWDVVCPSCRTAAEQLPELGALDATGHCDLCDIGFGVDMDRAVEASFRPSPAVRGVEARIFCTGGPGATPHVVTQAVLHPGVAETLRVPETPGRYRLFVRGGGGGPVEVGEGGPARLSLSVDARAEVGATRVAPGGALELRLEGGEARHAKLEHLEWASRAATAYEVSTVPAFRRAFGREALKPGLGLEVRRASLLFSDLSASTALYAREGDAAAFRLVQDHFELLEGCIARHGGAIVKTIGDAVMASFVDERGALAAALAAQRAFPAFRAERPASEGVFLKIGVFAGPCYAVTANGALDFFGQTVNVAARLQGQAADGETVASAALLEQMSNDPLLEGVQVSEAFVPRLKGVDHPMPVVRLTPCLDR